MYNKCNRLEMQSEVHKEKKRGGGGHSTEFSAKIVYNLPVIMKKHIRPRTGALDHTLLLILA